MLLKIHYIPPYNMIMSHFWMLEIEPNKRSVYLIIFLMLTVMEPFHSKDLLPWMGSC